MRLPTRPYWPFRALSARSKGPAAARKPEFPSFSTLFDVAEQRLAPVRSQEDLARSLDHVKKTAAIVVAKQKNYQPIYGTSAPSPREQQLRLDCKLVQDEFASAPRKNQVRILDVGCNAGFVSFVLAETFPMTVGFDINPPNINLCQSIKDHSGSPARFFNYNFLDVVDEGRADLENVDCVLLLNVVHELIFAKGLDYVKGFIARLARSVDFMVVELATRAEYVPTGRGHLLPVVPAEVLEECTNSTVTLARMGKRPVYTIRRREIVVGEQVMPYSERRFSNQSVGRNSRKYYFGGTTFTKMFRFSSSQSEVKYTAELNGLRRLEGLDVAPRPLSWDNDGRVGRICMERFYGVALPGALPHFDAEARHKAIMEIIRIGAALAQRGVRQSDFSAHNLLILSDGTMRMIDFEFAVDVYSRDSFGSLLWLVNDILKGRLEAYEHLNPDHLALPRDRRTPAGTRVNATCYPSLDAEMLAPLGPELTAILEEAATTPLVWDEFIQAAWARIAPASPGTSPGTSPGISKA